MSRKILLLMLLALLLGTLNLVSRVEKAKASGTIYINADGSISPPDAPISSTDDVSYTLTGNISDPIVIGRDNILVDGAGCTLQGNGSSTGIDISSRNNVTIKNTTIRGFYYGISISVSSSNIIITENTITANNEDGILLHDSTNNTVSRNTIAPNNQYGIFLWWSSDNVISGNNITNNDDGIYLHGSSNNSMTENNIANNGGGIKLVASSDNSIYHNNLVNNPYPVYDLSQSHPEVPSSINTWNDGYPSDGNYWSDYNGTDGNGDGVGDTPYIIDENNTDHYPLMGMFSEFDWISIAAPEQRIQTICNSTISNLVYNGTGISFDVTGDDGTSGFCRIQIPKVFMNSTFAVFVNGTEIAYTLLPSSNENYTYLYFNYTHSTEQVIIVPESPSFLILPLFMIATPLAVLVYRKKHAKISGAP